MELIFAQNGFHTGVPEALAKISVEQALLKAKSHAKKDEIEEAKKLYTAVLQAFPKNIRAQQGLAALTKVQKKDAVQTVPEEVIDRLISLYNTGKLSAAVAQAKALTEQYPEAFILWNVLGAASKGLGRMEAAASAFKKVTDLNPTYADGFNNLGVTLKAQGKLDEAIKAFDRALAIKPGYSEAYNNKGNALKNKGRLDEAIVAYNKALSIKPEYSEACNNLGSALKAQGKLDAAIAACNRALSLNPDYADAHNTIGNALKAQGKLEAAMVSYNKALSIKPDNADTYYNIGNAFTEQGTLDKAIVAYNKSLSLNPDFAEAHNNLGNALKDQGQLEAAIAAYKKALSLKPDYADAYSNMGNALNEQGRLEKAIDAYNKALSLKPDYTEASYNMGNALKAQGKLEQAIAAYNQALTIKPDHAASYNNMGNALKEQGKLEAAMTAYKKALSLEPDYAEAARNLVKLPIGSVDRETISELGDKLSSISSHINDQSQKLFFEANLLSHKGKYEKAFNIFIDANNIRSQEDKISLKSAQKQNDADIKRIRRWSVNLQPAEETLIKKLFLLGPSRSGKSTLEKILVGSPNVYPMFENINLQTTDENDSLIEEPKKPSMTDLFHYEESGLLKLGYDVITSTKPEAIFHIDRLIDALSGPFCIFVRRNHTDIAAEIFTREYSKGNFYSYAHSSIFKYLDSYEAIWEIIKQKIPQLTLEVSFEDIISKPQETVEKIGQLADVSFEIRNPPNQSITNLPSPFREHYARRFMAS